MKNDTKGAVAMIGGLLICLGLALIFGPWIAVGILALFFGVIFLAAK